MFPLRYFIGLSNFAVACITIPDIHPQRAIISQYPLALAEHVDQVGDVSVGRDFETDLTIYAIITQAVVNKADWLLSCVQNHPPKGYVMR